MSEPPHLDRGLELARWFEAPSRQDWEAEATRLLRGRPLADLDTLLPGGIACPPLFTPADLPPEPLGVPDRPPFRRGAGVLDRRQAGWDVRACVDAGSLADGAAAVSAAAEGGARSVWLVPDALGRGLDDGRTGLPLRCEDCLDTVLAGVDLASTPVHLTPGRGASIWVGALAELARRRGVPLDRVTGAVPVDPLADLVEGGAAAQVDPAFDGVAHLLGSSPLPWVQLVGVSSLPWAARGADPVLELAGMLAAGAETLRRLHARGLSPEAVVPRLLVQVSVGRDTFLELAKLRAVRWLWSRLLAAWGAPAEAQRVFVHAVTAPSLLAGRDPWVNLLRGTHGVFCAAVAGADAITMLPWDRALGVPTPHAHRVAVTSQAVLEAEAHLARVADPAGGSWYVEWLTDQLARRAWAVLQELEAEGGLAASWSGGTARRRLEEARAAQEAAVARRTRPVLGVSVFPNADERVPAHTPAPLDLPFREAAPWEALRAASEAAPQRPVAWLATLGPLKAHGGRADFARQLAQAVGFEVVEGAAEAVQEADVVFVCGADAAYVESLDALLPRLAGRPVVLAGRPPADRAEAWRRAGLTHAVSLGADVLAVVTDVLAQVGVVP